MHAFDGLATPGLTVLRRTLLAGILGIGLGLVALPRPAAAADPTPSPASTAAPR